MSIFYGREGDSPEPFEDPVDQLDFSESLSPGEDNYEPNEDELDVNQVTKDNGNEHDANVTPSPNS